MAESVFLKPVSFIFAIITLIESLIWTVLSFLAILCYNDIFKDDKFENYGLEKFVENLYDLYLSANTYKDRAVTQDTFYALMWIYFLLSLFLSFASGIHISVLKQKSNIRKINISTIVWLSLAYTVCLYDFITCILFGVDYQLMKDALNKKNEVTEAEQEIKLAVIITLLVLSAKGFILWIVNIVFSVIITVLFRKKVNVNNEPILWVGPEIHARNFSAYDAYGDVTIDDTVMEDNNNLKSRSSKFEKEEEPYTSINGSAWFTELPFGNAALSERAFSPSNDSSYDVLTTNSTLSRIPRASSFRLPRSLAASLSPSPVPPPSKEMPRTGRRSAPTDMSERDRGYEAYNRGYKSDDEYDNDDVDDVSESMSRMTRVFPQHRRFHLDEPDPDYLE